jgi:hypothetical protein
MAKTLSVYLTTDEAKELDRFCEEFNVTPYRALRLALQLLFKENGIKRVTQSKETSKEAQEQTQAKETPPSESRSSLADLLEEIKKQ